MLLNTKSIAVNAGIICFFVIGLIGWCSGLLPLTCCKRAMAGAAGAYVVMTLAAKAINSILLNAIVNSEMRRLEEKSSGNRD